MNGATPSLELYYNPSDAKNTGQLVAFLKGNPAVGRLVKPIDLKKYYQSHRRFPPGIRVAPTLLEDHPQYPKIKAVEGTEEILIYLSKINNALMGNGVNGAKPSKGGNAPPPPPPRTVPVSQRTEPPPQQKPSQPNKDVLMSAMDAVHNPQKSSKGALLIDESIKNENWAKVAPPLGEGSRKPGDYALPEGFQVSVKDDKNGNNSMNQDYLSQREQLNQKLGIMR